MVYRMEKITSRRNPLCMHIKKLGLSRSYRYESGEFLCDGVKLLEEAVLSGAEICSVLTSSEIPFPLSVDTRVYCTTQILLDSVSPLNNAQDLLFVCKMSGEKRISFETGTHILLDRMQDPGNVGTIIRTAGAFGINSVIMTGGCADPYNPKAIRASMGAIFRQYICGMDLAELTALRDSGVRFIATAPDSTGTDIRKLCLPGAVIAIGNEGRGLSAGVLSLCDEKALIPVYPGCESLNASVAAAIVMWEAVRQPPVADTERTG